MAFTSLPSGPSRPRLIAPASAADAADVGPWLVEDVRGTVRIRPAGQTAGWQRLAGATAIAPDSEIATGKDGTAVLANGVDRIRLSPNSHLVLPAPAAREEAGLLTLIQQKLGRVFFDVGARPDRRFEVEGPFLVVLVKGTRFTVRTNYIANSVDVDQGTVEARATDDDDGPGTPVGAGQTASIFAGSDTIDVAPSEGDTDPDSANQDKGATEPGSRPEPRVREPEDPDGNGDGDGDGDGDDCER